MRAGHAAATLTPVPAAGPQGVAVRARVLVCADGSTSRLATQLGYCTAAPQGVSSRAYIAGGTHQADFDGVCFYPRWSLPGYAAIFKHAKDELGFCYYLIPAGEGKAGGQLGEVTAEDLRRLHEDAIRSDPFISRALGPNPKCERMRAGSLRIGGQGARVACTAQRAAGSAGMGPPSAAAARGAARGLAC